MSTIKIIIFHIILTSSRIHARILISSDIAFYPNAWNITQKIFFEEWWEKYYRELYDHCHLFKFVFYPIVIFVRHKMCFFLILEKISQIFVIKPKTIFITIILELRVAKKRNMFNFSNHPSLLSIRYLMELIIHGIKINWKINILYILFYHF